MVNPGIKGGKGVAPVKHAPGARAAIQMKRVSVCGLVVVVLALQCAVAGQQRNSPWHMITGKVVDQQNQPVAGARVCAEVFNGRVPCGVSNPNGEFSIAIDRVGSYLIYAEQLEKGYPPGNLAFYGKLWSELPKVSIDETSPIPPVTIKLGPKAGRLVLTVLDGTTNKPIEKGSADLCRLGEPRSFWSISQAWPKGQYEILTPEVPFTIKFQTWHGKWVDRKAFDTAGLPVETVQLELGARKEMTIRLY